MITSRWIDQLMADLRQQWPVELVPLVVHADLPDDKPREHWWRCTGIGRQRVSQQPAEKVELTWTLHDHDPNPVGVFGVGVVNDAGDEPDFVFWFDEPHWIGPGETLTFTAEWPFEISYG